MRAAMATGFVRGMSWIVPSVRCRLKSNGQKRAVLSFDDGPSAGGTQELLDVLGRFNVSALFFLVGQAALEHRDQTVQIDRLGHRIGNHTWSHIDAWRTGPRNLATELDRCEELLKKQIGQPPLWVRPPFGRITRGLVAWCRRNNRRLLLWDVMPPDFEPDQTAQSVADHLERAIRPGSVICLHDNTKARRVTAQALGIVLPRLLRQGWIFGLPSERDNSIVTRCDCSPEQEPTAA